MKDLTVVDLLLMLLAHPERPRQHTGNLDVFRTLFEREIGGVNLIFNLITAIGSAIIIAIVGIMGQSVVSAAKSDTAFLGTAGFALLVAVIGIGLVVFLLNRARRQIRQRYIYLIRLYHYLDGVH